MTKEEKLSPQSAAIKATLEGILGHPVEGFMVSVIEADKGNGPTVENFVYGTPFELGQVVNAMYDRFIKEYPLEMAAIEAHAIVKRLTKE